MNPFRIIEIQMIALKNNDTRNVGIKKAYCYASLENRKYTGPFKKFKKMIHDNYSPLLNFDYWGIYDTPERYENTYIQDVYVVKNNIQYIYQFSLSKQKQYYDRFMKKKIKIDNWRTDSVIMKSKIPISV